MEEAEIENRVSSFATKKAAPVKGKAYFRPSFDDYFMAIAKIVATRSTCDRLRAGAVLVKDNRIISTGYNGAPPGLPHCDGPEGHKMERGHCIRTVHAEENTILQVAALGGMSTKGATLYTLSSPCYHCAKKIVVAGVSRVVVGWVYRDPTVKEVFTQAGVKFELYRPDQRWVEKCREIFANGDLKLEALK